MKIFLITRLLIFCLFLSTSLLANTPKFKWEKLTDLPAAAGKDIQHGLANPFTGISNDVLLVGGGANFPNKSLVDGGKKVYHQDLYALTKTTAEDGSVKYTWKESFKLPYAVAYGASVPYDDGILCIGGRDSVGNIAKVFHLSWNAVTEQVDINTNYPDIPIPTSYFSAAKIGNAVYIAGGDSNNGASNDCYAMDLGAEKLSWIKLAPFPGEPRMQPVVAAQNNGHSQRLYVFGGYCNVQHPGTPFIATDGFVFTPPKELKEGGGEWEKVAKVKTDETGALTLAGGFGIPYGAHHIICIGGINKESFSSHLKRENAMNKAKDTGAMTTFDKLKAEWDVYVDQEPEAFKFNDYVMVYHTVTNTWHKLQNYPYDGPAGAPLVKWGEDILVVNGEIKPGVRTPRIAIGKMHNEPKFGTVNYIVLLIYLFFMLGLGYYFMKREKSTDDFFKGGSRIPWWAAGISIFATMLSSITYMAIPAMAYEKHWMPYLTAVAVLLTAPLIVRYYLPFFRKLNVTTAYEYLEKRFNVQTRTLASLMFMFFKVVRIGIVSYLPAVALTAVTGISIDSCIIFIGIVTIIYCAMGGVEAVIWGDVIQGITLVGGALLIIVFLIFGIDGGLGTIIETGIRNDKWHIFDFAFDFTQPVFWVCIFGGLALNIASYSGDQSVVQRYLTTRDEKGAARGIMLNGYLAIPIVFIFYFIGTALYTYYQGRPDELSVALEKPNAIFPYFIMEKMPLGVAGILIAAIFSATMSTLSSDINSAATAFTTDLYRRFKKETTDHECLNVARIATVIFGVLGGGFALYIAHAPTTTIYELFNQYVGLLVGGLGGLFLMGIFFPRINGTSAVLSFFVSLLAVFWVKEYTSINGWMYGFVTMGSCVVSGSFLGLFLGSQKNIKGLTLYD